MLAEYPGFERVVVLRIGGFSMFPESEGRECFLGKSAFSC